MSTAGLLWGLLFSSIGIGYCVYGRRQGANIMLGSGLALLAFPYFMPNAAIMFTLGALLAAIPFVLRR